MAEFEIDSRLLTGTHPLASLQLCDARLHADSRWAWIVLTPRRTGAREIEHLTPKDRAQLIEEVALAGSAVRAIGAAIGRPVEKLNVGALGNMVPQLHLHVIGRRADDPAWPGPAWGVAGAEAYSEAALAAAIAAALSILQPRTIRAAS